MKEIFEMKTEDIEECGKIYMGAFPSEYYSGDKQPFVRYFNPFIGDYDKYAFVLKDDNVVLGFITALRRPSILDNEHIFIDVIAISPEYQKQGNGSFMLNEFIKMFSKKPSKLIIITAIARYIFILNLSLFLHKLPIKMLIDIDNALTKIPMIIFTSYGILYHIIIIM